MRDTRRTRDPVGRTLAAAAACGSGKKTRRGKKGGARHGAVGGGGCCTSSLSSERCAAEQHAGARERSGKGGPDPRDRRDGGKQTKTTFPVRDRVPRGFGCAALTKKENAGCLVDRSLGGSVRSEGANVREMRRAQAGKVGIEQCTLPSSHRVAVRRMAARFVPAHGSVTWSA